MRARFRNRPLRLESLEARLALAAGFATLEEGVLKVVGTEKSDRIAILLQGSQVIAQCNRSQLTFDAGTVTGLQIDALGGNDRVVVASALAVDAIINGGAGNDHLQAGGGNDQLLGGGGNDHLSGGDGDDQLSGESGNDRLLGGAGDDELIGGGGADNLQGNAGNDSLTGEAGNDVIRGGVGDDTLGGGDGHDTLFGDDGIDWLDGGAANDVLKGGNGDDSLKGGAGNDNLDGNAGVNLLDGDEGTNHLKNGTVVDLDVQPEPEFQPLQATLSGPGFATGQVSYQRDTSGALPETYLHIVANGLALNATYNVVVNGVTLGQLFTDGDGYGEARFSTINDTAGEQTLPADLAITAGMTIAIDAELSGAFELA